MPAIATALVGPNALLREGLARILTSAGFRVVASASCTDDLVLAAGPKRRAALLIIDAADDLKAAVRQVEFFKSWCPDGRVAVLGDRDGRSDIISIFRAGANAYFTKEAPCDALIKYLELVMLGETILPAAMLSAVIPHADHADDDEERGAVLRGVESAIEDAPESRGPPQLSDREKCILNYLIEGESNKSIARKIDIAEATVKVHVKAILRKVRVQNRTQAAIWAMSNGSSIRAIGKVSALPASTEVSPSTDVAAQTEVSAQTDVTAQTEDAPSIVADLDSVIASRKRNGV
jgi:two-component system, NarL family, nitrate/nitrite response regulator NarL